MSTNFNWHVVKLICKTQVGNLANVVHAVGWTATGTMSQNGQTYTATEQGTCPVPFDHAIAFTEYGNLTESQVLNWVYSNIDKNKIETKIQKTLDLKANASAVTIVTPNLPW